MGYDIQNKDIRNKEIGNLECPFLLAISPGQRNFKSLIFHIKIGFDYYQCHKNTVNKCTINIKCANKKCPARHKLSVKSEFIIVTRINNRNVYSINISELKLRDIENWTVLKHLTVPHIENCKLDQNSGFFVHLQKIFREQHTELTKTTGTNQTKTVLDCWNLKGQHGPELEAQVLKSNKLESNSAYKKLKRFTNTQLVEEVPHHAFTVSETNFDDSLLEKNAPPINYRESDHIFS